MMNNIIKRNVSLSKTNPMIKGYTFLILLLITCFSLSAQYGETISTDRPGQAIGPFTVGVNVFQIQAGNDFNSFEDQNSGIKGTSYIPNSVFRFGLTDLFEVSSTINFQHDKFENNNITSSQSGISTIDLGLRNNIYVGEGLIPSLGIQFNLKLPFADEVYNSNYIAPKITLMTAQSLSDKLSFSTNVGAAWNGNDANPTGFYILNLGYSITDKFGTFVEYYGYYQNETLDAKFDGGFSYLVNSNLQFDISGGYDKNDPSYSEWFVSAGISWRTRFKNKKTIENE